MRAHVKLSPYPTPTSAILHAVPAVYAVPASRQSRPSALSDDPFPLCSRSPSRRPHQSDVGRKRARLLVAGSGPCSSPEVVDVDAHSPQVIDVDSRDGYYIPSYKEVHKAVLLHSRKRVKKTHLRTALGLEDIEFNRQYARIIFINSYVECKAAGKNPYQLGTLFWPTFIVAIRLEFPHIYQGPNLLARVRETIHHIRGNCFPDVKLNMRL
ncbi:hypothetical protein R3P38DRAFT_2773434 [Favolaschia claudopus]|uniref:Uncharacterized protein n=1 Tax=Favolaschia claudopus TaxID=2862362 RepID=A0AAW0C2T6_9AGAR